MDERRRCVGYVDTGACVCGDAGADEHYKRTPVFADLPPQLAQLIVRSIAINSAYTSRVLVSIHRTLLNTCVQTAQVRVKHNTSPVSYSSNRNLCWFDT